MLVPLLLNHYSHYISVHSQLLIKRKFSLITVQLKKYNLLSWDNMIKYVHVCLMYKIIHGLTSPPLKPHTLDIGSQEVQQEGIVLSFSGKVLSVSLRSQYKLQ